MSAMIPHHPMAITRSEKGQISDMRVCELAVVISESQRREIIEMELIEDVGRNGVAATPKMPRHDPSLTTGVGRATVRDGMTPDA